MCNIGELAGNEVVGCDDAITFGKQPVAEMRTQEPGAAGYNRP